MAKDMGLTAELDAFGHQVVLTVRQIRTADLRHLAEAFANDSEHVIAELRELAAQLDRPAEGWDEAVIDFEVDMGMDEPAVELGEDQARGLAVELGDAAAKTFSARSRRISWLPAQKDVA
jgi:hypothetical protein